MMRKLVALILTILLTKAGFSKEIKLSQEVEKNFNIKTMVVKKEVVSDKDEFPGVVSEDPKNSYMVSSVVDGVLDKLLVKKGSFVKKGQVIATVISPEINQIKSQIEIAKVKVETAKNILERDQMLYHEEVIPFSRYYSSKVEYENAIANLRALEKTLASYGKVKENKLLITAKESGVVLDVYVLAGSPVGIGKEIAKISDISNILVVTQIPPERIEIAKIGMDVTVKTPTDREIPGKVYLIDYQLDPQTRRNKVFISVKNSNYSLKPNMFVSVRFSKDREYGIVVPKSVVIMSKSGNYVVVKKGDKYILTPVIIGKKLDDRFVISEGLSDGDQVAVSGLNLLEREFFGGNR